MMLSERIANWVIQHRALSIALMLMTTLMLSAGLQKFSVSSDQRLFYSSNDSSFLALESIEDTYGSDRNIVIAVEPVNGDVFTADNLRLVAAITEFSWTVPYSLRVDSLTNHVRTQVEGDELDSAVLFDSISTLTADDLAERKRYALRQQELVNKIVSGDGAFTAIDITFAFPDVSADKARAEAVSVVEQKLQELRKDHSDIRFRISGNVVIGAALPLLVREDGATVMLVGAGLMIFFLLLLLRDLVSATVAMLTCLAAAVSGLGAMLWGGAVVTSVSINAPIIVIILGLADCIHIMVNYTQACTQGEDRRKAMKYSLAMNLKPVMLTSATTALSFFSLNFSESIPYHDLGNAVGVGVLFAMVASVLLFAPLITLFPVRRQPPQYSVRMGELSDWLQRHAKPVLACWVIVSAILLSLIPLNRLDDSILGFFDESLSIRQDCEWITDRLGGASTLSVSVPALGPDGINDPGYLNTLVNFIADIERRDDVRYTDSIAEVLENLNQVMHGDDSSWYKIPDTRELAGQYFLLYEMSLPTGFNLSHLVNQDRSASRVIINMREISVEQSLKWEAEIQQWFATHAPDAMKPLIGGGGLAFAHLQHRNILSLTVGFVASLCVVAIILIWALGSLKLGVISLVPNLLPAGIAFGIWALLSGRIGMGISIGFTMTLGIVVDDTIHMLSKFQHARRKLGLSDSQAIRYAMEQVGMAMIITSVVIMAGFSAILWSHFTPNRDVSIITIMTIFLALIADLILLPVILFSVYGKQQQAKSDGQKKTRVLGGAPG